MSRGIMSHRYLPGIAVRAPTAMVALGVAMSLGVHLGMGAIARNQPIGYVDMHDLTVNRSPIRIKRAMYDVILPPIATTAVAQENPADLSEQMLGRPNVIPPTPPLRTDLQLPEPLPPTPIAESAFSSQSLAALPPAHLDTTGLLQPTYHRGTNDAFDTYGTADTTSDVVANRMLAGTTRNAVIARTPPPVASIVKKDGQLNMDIMGRSLDQLVTEMSTADVLIDVPTLAPKNLASPQPLDDDFDYLLSRYSQAGGPGYFRVQILARRSLRKLPTMPKDVVFLVDTSESLSQTWVNEIVRGIKQSLLMLNDRDRFNIVLFNEQVQFFDPRQIQPATQSNIARGKLFLDGAQSAGFTDVNAALTQLLQRDIEAARVYDLILISDGLPTRGVIDTRDLINLITRDNDLAASIYCVGVGQKSNRQLLNFLAYRNRGYCLFADKKPRVAVTITNLMSRIRYPLIKNVRHHFAGSNVDEVYPIDMPNIHQSESFSLFGRYTRTGRFTMRLAGQSAHGPVKFSFFRYLADAAEADRMVSQTWAFWKLHHLYSEVIRTGEDPQLLHQIEMLQNQYGLQTLY